MREDTTGMQREAVLLGPANPGAKNDLIFGEDPKSSVAIPKALITRIWDQAREGVKGLRLGGLEVGGLMVGRRVSGQGIVVDETIPLPIEYREGPSFQLSPSDLATVPALVESAHRASKLVVGFYRSRTRGEGALRPSDLLILEAVEKAHESYPEDFRCCLFLAPKSPTLAVLCVALRNRIGWTELQPITLQSNPSSGAAQSAPSALEPVVRAAEKEAHAPPSRSTGIPASEPRVQENRAASSVQRRIPKAGVWRYAAVGLVGVAALWAAVGQFGTRTSRTQREAGAAHLGFSAAWEGPRWKLTWDRAAIDTLSPVGGVLSVDDGVLEQQIPLALADLASGTLFYTPRRENLTFSLRIDRGGSHVEEHVRVVVAPGIETDAGLDVAPEAGRAPVRSAESSGGLTREARPDRENMPPRAGAFENVGRARLRNPVEVTVEMSVPPAVSMPTTGPDSAPLRSEVPAGRDGTGRVAPVTARVATERPASEFPPVPEYVGPKAIQQPRPQLPANLLLGLEAQITVEIDTRGKVTKVIPIRWRPSDAPLVVWAVRAVSFWVFEPAKSDGQSVSSQVNLVFRS